MEQPAIPVMAMLPTWNEAGNIPSLIEALLALDGMHVVVVDDDSPDGTWRIVAEIAERDRRVHLVHRRGVRGRGSAGVAGFRYALDAGAALIVEMDADWSHHPRHIPAMLEAARHADVVIGSRLVPGGGESGRSAVRMAITRLANLYIRLVLGVSVRDCTSGFRVFRREALERINLAAMRSNGPAIVQEVLVACRRAGCTFAEVPIHFEQRRAGKSTLTWKILVNGLFSVLRFRFGR
ncbi:MAG: polyprenol monophosphomannose synthase [Candidatus Sumerlaeia bacterium]|nr:polyprenol monophosphomannose synthase [Candidatus Sumerlaeia bacterium]